MTADRAVTDAGPRPSGRDRVPAKWVRGAVGVGVLLLVMEAVTRAGLVTREYLPPASSILRRTFELLTDGVPHRPLGDVAGVLIGLGIAIVVAVPVGVVLGLADTRTGRRS